MTKQTTIVVIGALRINNYKAPDKINIEVIILDKFYAKHILWVLIGIATLRLFQCVYSQLILMLKRKKKKKKGKLQTISFIWIYVASEFL